LPRIISGASSGSIIAAFLCTKTDDEIPTWFYEMQNLDFVSYDVKIYMLLDTISRQYYIDNFYPLKEVFDKKDRPDTLYTRLCRLFKRGNLRKRESGLPRFMVKFFPTLMQVYYMTVMF